MFKCSKHSNMVYRVRISYCSTIKRMPEEQRVLHTAYYVSITAILLMLL